MSSLAAVIWYNYSFVKILFEVEFLFMPSNNHRRLSSYMEGGGRALGVCERVDRVRGVCGRVRLGRTLRAIRGLSERTRSLRRAAAQPGNILPAH